LSDSFDDPWREVVSIYGISSAQDEAMRAMLDRAEIIVAGIVLILGLLFYLAFGVFLPAQLRQDRVEAARLDGEQVVNRHWLSVYNNLHPRIQERLPYEKAREVLENEPALHNLIPVAMQLDEDGCGTVEYKSVVHGTPHRVILKREMYSGFARMTDGHIVSLVETSNAVLLSDVMVDGHSIFSQQP
jgi:hypothetical protein